jgi:hypothetical protein
LLPHFQVFNLEASQQFKADFHEGKIQFLFAFVAREIYGTLFNSPQKETINKKSFYTPLELTHTHDSMCMKNKMPFFITLRS